MHGAIPHFGHLPGYAIYRHGRHRVFAHLCCNFWHGGYGFSVRLAGMWLHRERETASAVLPLAVPWATHGVDFVFSVNAHSGDLAHAPYSCMHSAGPGSVTSHANRPEGIAGQEPHINGGFAAWTWLLQSWDFLPCVDGKATPSHLPIYITLWLVWIHGFKGIHLLF